MNCPIRSSATSVSSATCDGHAAGHLAFDGYHHRLPLGRPRDFLATLDVVERVGYGQMFRFIFEAPARRRHRFPTTRRERSCRSASSVSKRSHSKARLPRTTARSGVSSPSSSREARGEMTASWTEEPEASNRPRPPGRRHAHRGSHRAHRRRTRGERDDQLPAGNARLMPDAANMVVCVQGPTASGKSALCRGHRLLS